MNEDRFWHIVSKACGPYHRNREDWDDELEAALKKLDPDEIIEWNHVFDRLAALAYTVDMWGAAYLINGGASDDGFYYFRCWLIGMGRNVYEAAIANPDNLADVVDPDLLAEAEIYAAAHQAWMAVTGNPDTASYPARNESAELRGQAWDFENPDEVRRRLPRLAAVYLK